MPADYTISSKFNRQISGNEQEDGLADEHRILTDNLGRLVVIAAGGVGAYLSNPEADDDSIPAGETRETSNVLLQGYDPVGTDWERLHTDSAHRLLVSVGNWPATQPISAAALPLPAGASTSAIQATMDTSLNEIESAIENLEEALASIGTDRLLVGDAGAIINLDAAGHPQVDVITMPVVTIQDGGGSITIDGTVSCDYPQNLEADDDQIPRNENHESVIGLLHGYNVPSTVWERIITDTANRLQTTAIITDGTNNAGVEVDCWINVQTRNPLLTLAVVHGEDLVVGAGNSEPIKIRAEDGSLPYGDKHLITASLMMGDDGTDWHRVLVDASGHLQTDVLSMPVVAVTGTFWQVTQPISAAALPLPAGAATSANQTTVIGHLNALDDALQSIGTDYLLIGDAGSIINLDAAGDVQVDVLSMPVVAVTGTFWQATQPISAAALPLPAGAATSANQTTVIGHLNALDDALQSIGTDYLLIGDAGSIINLDAAGDVQVDVLSMPVVAVTGTFWQATQPISAAALPLPTGAATSANQVTIAGYLNALDDALESIGTDSLLSTIEHGGNTAVVLPATSISDPDLDGLNLFGVHALMSGRIDVDTTIGLLADASGHLQIDVITAPVVAVTGTFWQVTQPVSGTFWQVTQPISAAALPLPAGAATAAIQGTMDTSLNEIEDAIENLEESLASIATDYLLIGDAGAVIHLDAAGDPQVDVLTMPVVAVTGTFWQATQPISAVALPLPTGAATEASLQGCETALQIMDDWDSGNRCKVEIDQVDAVYNPETDDGQIPDGEVHDSVIAVLYAYNTDAADLKRVLVNNSGALMVYTP